jgi:hypothetical protein
MIVTLGPPQSLDYYDSQSVTLVRPVAPLDAWNIIMASPQPVLRAAFAVRDAISARFGVKRIGGFTGARVGQVAVGDYLDFFLVEDTTPEHLVLTERDRHLDVMTCVSCEGTVLTITSSVITHNWFGRAYMLPVGVAHKVIVRGMLDRLARAVAASG